MPNSIYHFVYKTTNTINGKIYIGVHSTKNLDDGYIGSGNQIRQAISKYGKPNFKREIIKFFDTQEEAYTFEAKIVDESFIENQNTYNVALGGHPGNSWWWTEERKQWMSKQKKGVKKSKESIERMVRTKLRNGTTNKGKSFSEIHKKRISEACKDRKMPTTKCPHCNKIGDIGNMKRWHFDNCKEARNG